MIAAQRGPKPIGPAKHEPYPRRACVPDRFDTGSQLAAFEIFAALIEQDEPIAVWYRVQKKIGFFSLAFRISQAFRRLNNTKIWPFNAEAAP